MVSIVLLIAVRESGFRRLGVTLFLDFSGVRLSRLKCSFGVIDNLLQLWDGRVGFVDESVWRSGSRIGVFRSDCNGRFETKATPKSPEVSHPRSESLAFFSLAFSAASRIFSSLSMPGSAGRDEGYFMSATSIPRHDPRARSRYALCIPECCCFSFVNISLP